MIKTPSQLKKADDLFEKSSMSFGEHLEALRKSLAWAFAFLGIGMAIGLPLANKTLEYLQSPLKEALNRYGENKTRKDIELKMGQPVSDAMFAWIQENHYYWVETYVDREDLRRALAGPNPSQESTPADDAENEESLPATETPPTGDTATNVNKFSVDRLCKVSHFYPIDTDTEALGMQEPFMIWLKAGFALGFIIASPGIFYSIWTFIAAGLYPHERRYVYFFLPIAIGLFLAGAALAFLFIFRFVIDFLLKFNEAMGIDASPRLTDYMSFAIFLPLGFGLAFQLPLAMLVMERLGIFSVKVYLAQWRAAVLIIAFLSMILTPAEPTSMIGMCVPLVGLYFLGIALCYWLPRKGSPHEGYDPQ